MNRAPMMQPMMRGSALRNVLAGCGILILAACGRAERSEPLSAPLPPMIARAGLFADADRANAQLSPRGEAIAFVALRQGAPALYVLPTASLSPDRTTLGRMIVSAPDLQSYVWSADGRRLLYTIGEAPDGPNRLYSIDVASLETTPLSESGRAVVLGRTPDDPGHVVIAQTAGDRGPPDLFTVDVVTGARQPLLRNSQRFFRLVLDRENKPRLGLFAAANGGVEVWTHPPSDKGGWRKLFTIPFEDALSTDPIAFEAGGRSFLMLDSVDRERAALVRVDAETGARVVLGESTRADVVDLWRDPSTGEPEAYAAEYLRKEWSALDAGARADIEFLARLPGETRVVSRSLDDKYWIVEEEGPTTAPHTYLYDRSVEGRPRLVRLFRNRPALENAPLQPMAPVEIEARDGLTLVSYLTLPIGADSDGDFRPETPAPLVIIVHDGPWARASYGFNALHQWLANRGYAALSVNFRGSSGFGKTFLNAGDRQWGAKMQDDLLDAAHWAVESRIAAPERVALFGEGYGGYATLAAMTGAQTQFACGVDVGGPSDLTALLAAAAARGDWRRAAMRLRVGDPDTPEGRTLLRARSPGFEANAVERPLLIGQGAHDALVGRGQSDVFAQSPRAPRRPRLSALSRRGAPV